MKYKGVGFANALFLFGTVLENNYLKYVMTHQEEMDALHRQSKSRLEEFILAKKEKTFKEEDHNKLQEATNDWELAWNKLQEAMLVLERLEI